MFLKFDDRQAINVDHVECIRVSSASDTTLVFKLRRKNEYLRYKAIHQPASVLMNRVIENIKSDRAFLDMADIDCQNPSGADQVGSSVY